MASIESNGITLEYAVRGEGDPLLLVMGLGAQMTDWPDEFVDGLVDTGFQVITFDNRDIGLSTEFTWQAPSQMKTALGMLAKRPVKAEYLLSDMAADAVGLLDGLGIESA
ncbi:MAG: alpha/beta hydrolase, partial [Ilumatobacteraceae bacterium]